MNLSPRLIEKLAAHIESCELETRATCKLTDDHPEMDYQDAYAIQHAVRARKLRRGAKLVGFKAALTSRAKMKQMGVETPAYGFLVDQGAVPEGGEILMEALIHPKVEPELAIVTKAVIKGPGCHIGAVLAATDFIIPAMEVIDSRYKDFKFDLRSVIADNTSAARFVVGGRTASADELDLRTTGIVLEKNGETVAFGAGAAVLGHPAAAVAMIANLLAARGEEIPADSLILTGGIAEAVPVSAGDSLTLRVQDLGSLSLRFG